MRWDLLPHGGNKSQRMAHSALLSFKGGKGWQ
jgi:hypothetical protein